MTDSTNPPDPQQPPNPETAYGGADAVEKTTYVVGQGTNPNREHRGSAPPPAGKTGTNPVFWLVIAIAVIVAIVYAAGIFR